MHIRPVQINRGFMEPFFEKYKLDTTTILPIYNKSIPEGIDIVHPSDDQYFFVQQREFSIHNYLHNDPWDENSVYFVTPEWTIKKFTVERMEDDDSIEGPFEVWEIPKLKDRIAGLSNVTICFIDEVSVVVSNGAGTLYILYTDPRIKSENVWKLLHTEDFKKPGRIVDARLPEQGDLHLLYVFVDSKNTYINHLNLINDGNKWELKKLQTVIGKGNIDYTALSINCSEMYVISQEELKPQEVLDEEVQKEEVISFDWQQNYEEVTLWLKVGPNTQPTVKISSTDLLVSLSGEILVEGVLYRPINEGLTSWSATNDMLEVVMRKRDEGAMWPTIFDISEFKGREIMDNEFVAEVHSKLAHLTSETEEVVGDPIVLDRSQTEECDISDNKIRELVVYDISSHIIKPKSKSDLGSEQWLIHGPRKKFGPPHFCIRFDVDCIVWQVLQNDNLRHISTFCAFGYIQASKTSRIYSFFPEDFSYVGIVDVNGQVFLYQDKIFPEGNKLLGIQHVLKLDCKEKVLGVHATPNNIFVLSANQLHIVGLHFKATLKPPLV